MLIRLFAYVVCATFTWYVGDLVFVRNFVVGIYQIDATGIPVSTLSRQALLVLLCVVLPPSVGLGNQQIFKKIMTCKRWLHIAIVFGLMLCYAMALLLAFLMLVSAFDKAHSELGICYAVFLSMIIGFLAWDIFQIYRYKKNYKNTDQTQRFTPQ